MSRLTDDLYHSFYLVIKGQYDYGSYEQYLVSNEAIEIDDILIQYLGDTLAWMPNDNNILNRRLDNKVYYGLDICGRTAISRDGAKILLDVLSSWINLFSVGPNEFILTGSYSISYDANGNPNGEYTKIQVKKSELLETLSSLASYSRRAIEEDLILLHVGL